MYQALGYAAEYVMYFCLLTGVVMVMSKWLNITPAQHRYQTLDGMRGVCATLVMIYHLYYRLGDANGNEWTLAYIGGTAAERFMWITGDLSVGFFFMLSGFLFFKKALADQLDVKKFIVGRIKRIYPPVLIVSLVVYGITLMFGPGPADNIFVALYDALPFLTRLNAEAGLINGVAYAPGGIAVFWTLVWEARLYCIIPLLYWVLKPLTLSHKRWVLIGVMIAIHMVHTYVNPQREWAYVMYFLGGFLVATINVERKLSSIMGLAILVVALCFMRIAYDTASALYITVVFYTIKCGCDYFGFLASRPIALLGTCSFSIYITHCVVQYVAKHYLYATGYHVWGTVSVICVGIIAPLMYYHVERRCIS